MLLVVVRRSRWLHTWVYIRVGRTPSDILRSGYLLLLRHSKALRVHPLKQLLIVGAEPNSLERLIDQLQALLHLGILIWCSVRRRRGRETNAHTAEEHDLAQLQARVADAAH